MAGQTVVANPAIMDPAEARNRRASLVKPGLNHVEWVVPAGAKKENAAFPHYAVLGQSKRAGLTVDEMRADIENTYTNPPGFDFKVRGSDYLDENNKKVKGVLKEPSQDSMYSIVGVNVFRTRKSAGHVLEKVQVLKDYIAAHTPKTDQGKQEAPRWLVLCWLFKSTFGHQHTAVVHLFRRNFELSDDEKMPGYEKSFRKFMAGDDKFKSKKLKFAFEIHEAPGALKKTVGVLGGERPVLIGKALTTKFYHGDNYLEIDMDVGSSTVASMLNSTILKASSKIITSTSWMIEAQEQEELPERLLGVVRWHYIDVSKVIIKLDEKFNVIPEGK